MLTRDDLAPDDLVIWTSPFTGADVSGSYRGDLNGQAFIYDGKCSQFAVEYQDLRRPTPTFVPTTEARYDEMLGALPPEAYFEHGFLVGEPANHRRCRITGAFAPVFDAFVQWKGQYYVSSEPLTIKEAMHLTIADLRLDSKRTSSA